MEECRNKRVLFVTAKNLDYLSNTQEIYAGLVRLQILFRTNINRIL